EGLLQRAVVDALAVVPEAALGIEDDGALPRGAGRGGEAVEIGVVAGLHPPSLGYTGPMDEAGPRGPPPQKAYYDAFARRYEERRDGRDPGGYHDLVDELEVGFVERFGRGGDVLEVGCGTGLLLRRIAGFARSARGVDLSPGMLERAKARGLDVVE